MLSKGDKDDDDNNNNRGVKVLDVESGYCYSSLALALARPQASEAQQRKKHRIWALSVSAFDPCRLAIQSRQSQRPCSRATPIRQASINSRATRNRQDW